MSAADWAYLGFHAIAFVVGTIMVLAFRVVMKRRTAQVKRYNDAFRAQCKDQMERTRSWGTAFAAEKNGVKAVPSPDPLHPA